MFRDITKPLLAMLIALNFVATMSFAQQNNTNSSTTDYNATDIYPTNVNDTSCNGKITWDLLM